MQKKIPYTNNTDLIKNLKKKKLIIEDIDYAIHFLDEYGYYNIINSYREPYIHIVNGKKEFISGTTFKQIFSLFNLDHNIRNATMITMLDIEEHLRAAAAEVIARNFGTDHTQYLQWNNYKNRNVTHHRFSLKGILSTLNQNIMSDKDPIKYYRENYGIVPPWILFRGTYFNTLVNFVRLFKNKQKEELIQIMYGIDSNTSSLDCVKKLFITTLFNCLDYRNVAAHGGRLYNFDTSYKTNIFDTPDIFNIFPCLLDGKQSEGISKLYYLIDCFDFDTADNILLKTIRHEINRHLSLYPQDQAILENVLGTVIYRQEIAFVSPHGKIYHVNCNCSGLQNPKQISLEKAKIQFKPCKKCCCS